jgi:hypothetical protein
MATGKTSQGNRKVNPERERRRFSKEFRISAELGWSVRGRCPGPVKGSAFEYRSKKYALVLKDRLAKVDA